MSQFCGHCGVPVEPGAVHCANCGGLVGEPPPTAAVPVAVPPPPGSPPVAPTPAPTPPSGGGGTNAALIAVVAVLATLVVVGIVALVLSRNDGDDATATSTIAAPTTTTTTTAATTTSLATTTSTSTTVATTTTAAPTTTPPATGPGDVIGQPAGLFCRDLKAKGYSYSAAVDYWRFNGQPDRMDADKNGIPCETVYPRSNVIAYWGANASDTYSGVPAGLYCRDLVARGFTYAESVAYWFATGAPDRMDADKNGIPCETVYPAAEVQDYWSG